MKIGVIGLGFVGISFASFLGSKGFEVIGIDSDKEKIAKIRKGNIVFYEPQLKKILRNALKKNFTVSHNINDAVRKCDLIFITVGTPQSKDGYIDLKMIKNVSTQIGSALSKVINIPLIIVKSTVLPGTTLNFIKKNIEKHSKKTCGKDFDIITNPEFLREGKAVYDTINPHVIVVGSNNNKSINKIKKFYSKLYGSKIPIYITSHNTAELIKYTNNSFLATKISFINYIANLCQLIPGTNVDEVAKVIGMDPRIGKQFLMAGPGFGGSCLPKDLQAMIKFSSKIGLQNKLLTEVKNTNNLQLTKIINLVKKSIGNIKNKKITILGLSFKENSDDIRDSVAIKLIKILLKNEAKVIVHDPKAIDNTRKIFNEKIQYAETIQGSLKNSNCAIIMTPWQQYTKLKNSNFKNMKQKIVIDTRRILSYKNLKIKYYAIGICN